jgi:DNA polymerase-4
MNNFYASVECLYNPSLRDKPVAVGGDPELRHGIVLAKNYIAKQYGIQTGEALWQAKQKCPDIVFVPPHFDKYLRFSKMAKEIYSEYTDQVESFGLDECWLDVSGSTHLFGSGKHIADEIRAKIKYELGITASIGVSYNKIFAKLGSDMKKPDATTVIEQLSFQDSIWNLPVSDLLYVGRATTNKLKRYYINTIGDLAKTDVKWLEQRFGKIGIMLWQFANGLDTSPVSNIGAKSLIKSVGNSTTTPRDLTDPEDIKITMYILCESVAARLREYDFKCRTVHIYIRDNELESYTRQGKLLIPCSNSDDIFKKAYELYGKNHNKDKPIRSIGVKACDLVYDEYTQLSLMPEIKKIQERDNLERAIDSVRNRFGHQSIQRGIMLSDTQLSDLDPKNDHIIHPVSFLR